MPLEEKDRFGRPIQRKSTEVSDRMATNSKRFEGKVVVCFAASLGIGYACARR